MDSLVMSFSDCYTSLIQTKVSRRLLPCLVRQVLDFWWNLQEHTRETAVSKDNRLLSDVDLNQDDF